VSCLDFGFKDVDFSEELKVNHHLCEIKNESIWTRMLLERNIQHVDMKKKFPKTISTIKTFDVCFHFKK
jgi:hypothetical protein